MLGDFSFHHQKETQKILRRLNGTKYLIIGNHDSGINGACKELFTGGVAHYHKLKCDGQPIILCHYAFRSWDQVGYGSWNLHGHSHGNLPPFGKQLDVGVDVHKYRPISYWEVAEYMKHRQIETADHH